MKIVLISPKDYLNEIVAFGKEQQEHIYLNIGFCDAEVKGMKCYESLDDIKNAMTGVGGKETLSGFMASESDYQARQVFIVPELGWEGADGTIDQGYEIAEMLLDYFNDKPFVLHFISMFTQEQLLKMVKIEHRTMVKVFPHICCLKQKAVQLNLKAYSETHYHLIKDIAISNSGRLDYIRHQVNAITSSSIVELKDYTLNILSDLYLPVYLNSFSGCKDKIDALALETKTLSSNDEKYRKQLQHKIMDLIDAIERALKSDSAAAGSKLPYSVLILDDDLSYRIKLYKFFSARFSNVSCNDLEKTLSVDEVKAWDETNIGKQLPELKDLTIKNANKWLQGQDKKSKMARTEHFNIVILDLLYMENGIWLPFSGLDLYGIVKDKNPYCTVRVITSLPRNEIGAITSKSKIVLPLSHIFTKGNGLEKLEGCLIDRIDEMERECEKNDMIRRKNVQLPDVGEYFGQPRWEYLIKSEKIKIEDFMVNALELAENGRWEKCPLPKHGCPFKDDSYSDFLKNCLPHRLALLKWMAANNNGRYELTSYWGERGSDFRFNKGKYLGEIGFSNKEKGKYLDFCKSKLFPEEEKYYLDEILKERKTEVECLEIYQWWIWYIYPSWFSLFENENEECLVEFKNGNIKVENVTLDQITKYLDFFLMKSGCYNGENHIHQTLPYFPNLATYNVEKTISKKYKKLLEEIVKGMPDEKVMTEKIPGYYELLLKYKVK